jgi:ribonuclease-3
LTADIDKLEEQLGYRFGDPALLEQALTHRSAAALNNERLEFLGDGILNFVVAAELYHRKPDLPEGDLSRLRASMVNQSSLARVARQMDLGTHLRLGTGEMKSGGHRRESILSDGLEAVFGAIYLDSGFETARRVIIACYGERLEHLPEVDELKDPKTRLQEYLQSGRLPLPRYEVLEVSGKAHSQSFSVECRIDGVSEATVGEAKSRRQAEQRAAQTMLERLRGDPGEGS